LKIQPEETDIVGKWIVENGKVHGDPTCQRIERLTSHHLRKIAIGRQSGGWETLFQDPEDGRYWEQTYPQSETHGGGPPRLIMLTPEQARMKIERQLERQLGSHLYILTFAPMLSYA